MMTRLVPKAEREKSQEELKKEIRNKLRKFPGLKVSAEDISLMGSGQRQVPIQYSVRGRDLMAIETYTKQIAGESSRLAGIVDVDTSRRWGSRSSKSSSTGTRLPDLGVDVADHRRGDQPYHQRGRPEVTKYKDESRETVRSADSPQSRGTEKSR